MFSNFFNLISVKYSLVRIIIPSISLSTLYYGYMFTTINSNNSMLLICIIMIRLLTVDLNSWLLFLFINNYYIKRLFIIHMFYKKKIMEEILRVFLCTWNNHVDYEKWWRNSLKIKRFIIELGLSHCFIQNSHHQLLSSS